MIFTRTTACNLIAAGLLLFAAPIWAQSQTLSIAPDSPRWDLEGDAKVVDYQGKKSLRMDGAAAVLRDFEMRDGVIDVDVNTPAKRGFVGFDFRIDKDQANYEEVYFRQHQSGYPDALQYTPVLGTGRNWQLFNGPGFTAATEIPKNEWFHMRLEVTGAQAKLYMKDMEKPVLVMDDLKSGVQTGQIALYDLTGETYFANFEVRTTPDVPWERHLPPMPPNTLTKWSISPAFDALKRNLETPLSAAEAATMKWQDVEAEPPGFVVLQRYREAPHPRVSFQYDFSTTPGAATRNEDALRQDQHRFRARPGEEIGTRVQRRRQRLPEWQDLLPRA